MLRRLVDVDVQDEACSLRFVADLWHHFAHFFGDNSSHVNSIHTEIKVLAAISLADSDETLFIHEYAELILMYQVVMLAQHQHVSRWLHRFNDTARGLQKLKDHIGRAAA